MPEEIGSLLSGSSAVSAIVLQLAGATYFGFAMINWGAKGVLLGGIYGRPITAGNFAHLLVGTITLVKAAFGAEGYYLWILGACYGVFAIWFGLALYTHPKDAQ